MTRIDYSLFEDKYYQMDPRREDLLFDGTELQEGMIVLIENSELRAEIGTGVSGEQLEKAMRYNRWAMVTRPSVEDTSLKFLAVYADGSKKKIELSVHHAWLVLVNDYEPPSFEAVKEYVEREVRETAEALKKEPASGMAGIDREKILLDEDIDLRETAIGTAKVEEHRAWATRSTPPFGGGDGDLHDPLPKREVGAIFNDLYEQKQREVRENETQI